MRFHLVGKLQRNFITESIILAVRSGERRVVPLLLKISVFASCVVVIVFAVGVVDIFIAFRVQSVSKSLSPLESVVSLNDPHNFLCA